MEPEHWQRLAHVLGLNRTGSDQEHILIAMPSFGLGESTLSHYASRIPALEHRYLNGILLLGRIKTCRMIYLCSEDPGEVILDYYFSLMPGDTRQRFHLVVVPDSSPRSLAQKLLDRSDTLEDLRALIGSRPAFIEPWNVTEHELAVASRLEAPINGTLPHLWPLGFKSSCRRIFKESGVPVPFGCEGVQTLSQAMDGIESIQRSNPGARGAVIKHDNSGSGDGNAVIKFDAEAAAPVVEQLAQLPEWYVNELARGGVVEELIGGEDFASPSAQLDILPDGETRLIATHEQVLGGPDNQVYQGCGFPADRAYAALLAGYSRAVGDRLSALGVRGRFSVDFVAARNGGAVWRIYALEVNLRKGGTTHPFAALRNLCPGRYDEGSGQWLADRGGSRGYYSTDNLVNTAWLGLSPSRVIAAIKNAGLHFDGVSGTGVILHMLSCLGIDGRFGLTAIATSESEARAMCRAAVGALPV